MYCKAVARSCYQYDKVSYTIKGETCKMAKITILCLEIKIHESFSNCYIQPHVFIKLSFAKFMKVLSLEKIWLYSKGFVPIHSVLDGVATNNLPHKPANWSMISKQVINYLL